MACDLSRARMMHGKSPKGHDKVHSGAEAKLTGPSAVTAGTGHAR